MNHCVVVDDGFWNVRQTDTPNYTSKIHVAHPQTLMVEDANYSSGDR
jgi:hypothetical protein